MFSKCIENCNKLIEGREEMMGRDSNALYQVIQSVYLLCSILTFHMVLDRSLFPVCQIILHNFSRKKVTVLLSISRMQPG